MTFTIPMPAIMLIVFLIGVLIGYILGVLSR